MPRSKENPSAQSRLGTCIDRIFYDYPDATVDICFVYGLTGNRDNTCPGGRLLTYGYDAYVVRKSATSANRLIDYAANLFTDLTNDRVSYNASSRRFVFVVYSLGGLVCKEAVLLSRNNPTAHLRGIFDCVVGIAFMGTPYRGSTRFWSMVREVRESGRPLEVTCFFEELPVPAIGRVVPKESATLEGYTAVSVHADHRDMVRFGSADDNGFKRLFAELTRWQELIDPTPSSQQATLQKDDGARTS
ncbi:hypothetical protein GE09DRAFT_1179664 [Coniochaeta sp. 2T2.1]|nr:hypothetical protein GE09DRAFT_1179664 [Coniochaeta sp. 2T2.1]